MHFSELNIDDKIFQKLRELEEKRPIGHFPLALAEGLTQRQPHGRGANEAHKMLTQKTAPRTDRVPTKL